MTQIPERTWEVPEDREIRDDLTLFDYALSLGYKARTSDPIVVGLPHGPISYYTENKTLWKHGEFYGDYDNRLYIDWWVCADLIDNRYQNHRKHNTLKEALDAETQHS